MVLIVKEINGQKKLIPLTSDVGIGVPLGTLEPFTDDIPKDGYLQTGTTFDETKYPALYALLGSNQIPAYFDHSRPSDYETITIPTSSATAITADYDGEIVYSTTSDTSTSIYINDTLIVSPNGRSNYSNSNFAFTVKKGDTFYVTVTNGSMSAQKARWYKHPLFIKATSGLSENQQENVLNILKSYERDQNELSDYESITIGKTAETANTMEYDGYINIIANSTGTLYVYLNGETLIYYRLSGTSYCDLPVMIAVKKGDVIYTNNVTTSASKARFYKKRDYTGR